MTQEQGIAALKAGDYTAAVEHLKAAAEDDSGNGALRYNLAQALRNAGRQGEAILQATHALARDPGLKPAARLLGYLLSHLRLLDPCGIDPRGLATAFHFIDVDHQILAPTALDYVKQCTPLGDALVLGATRGWDAGAEWLLSSKGRAVLRDPLLQTTLSASTNTDLDIECLLTALRKALLLGPHKDTLRKPYILEFAIVLARQSEINEYVFAVSEQERLCLDRLFVNTRGIRDGSRAAADTLLLMALYAPLWRLLGNNGGDIDGRTIRPKVLGDFIAAHMAERRAQFEAAQGIKFLGDIDDKTSQSVAQQYEENPYPRWLSLHVPETGSRRDQLAAYFSDRDLKFMDTPFKVLIAGAGTGQQATEAALGYGMKAALTAIEISLSSLAYARRMASRFEAGNLQFVRCDILNADLLDDVFDVIECVGVLHHMDDPWRGWKILVNRLRSGGIMKIGLYSRAARTAIATLRKDLKTDNLTADEATIRAYRQDIIARGDGGKAAFLRQSSDFYSLSNFRDLMFHVSEHHLAIPEIAAFLSANDLLFHGFQLPLDLAAGYPDGEAMTDLERWRKFEESNPETFKGMYVFWCRKN